jgi:phasin
VVAAGETAFQQAKARTGHKPLTGQSQRNHNDIMAREESKMSDTTQSRGPKSARAPASTAAEDNIAAQTLRAEAPSSVVDLLDKSLARAKDAHEKAAAIFEHSTGALEEVYTCAKRGSGEYQQKLVEIARINANAAFDMAHELAGATTLPEMFERFLAHQRKQFELFTAQMKDLSALTQKVVTETTEPIRSNLAEPFKIAS